MNMDHQVKFLFYGYGIEVRCEDPQTLESIRRDYSFFIDDKVTADVLFKVYNRAPDYKTLPSIKAKFYTPRNICYKQGNVSFIDYFGKGLTVIDHEKNIYEVFSSDHSLRHEIIFLSMLSLVGQHLDSIHLHRVHGLGLAVDNAAVLVLLPSGGGKTTLFLELVKNDSIHLISEDSPLINANGNVLPFPIRIGVTQQNKPKDIPEDQLHLIRRMEFGSKYIIDVNFFKSKIVRQPLPLRYILCGVRSLGAESSITPLGKSAAFNELVKNSVVGLGLYQGVEFLFQHGVFGVMKKSGILISRLWNAGVVLSWSRTYSFVLGSDQKKNAETFLDFFRGLPKKSREKANP